MNNFRLEQNIECQELLISKNKESDFKDSVINYQNHVISSDSAKLEAYNLLRQDQNENLNIVKSQLRQSEKKVFNRTILGCLTGLLGIIGTVYFAAH